MDGVPLKEFIHKRNTSWSRVSLKQKQVQRNRSDAAAAALTT